MLRILLVGYGKMGQEIEQSLRLRRHSLAGIVDPYMEEGDERRVALSAVDVDAIDVVIDFSVADSFLGNYNFYAKHGLPVIVGTTGWYDAFEAVSATFQEHGGGCVYGTNFSIGAQLFLKMVAHAAALVSPLAEYDLMLTEAHHKQKIDSPSGTANSAAKAVLRNHRRKKRVVSDSLQRAIKEDELHLTSLRGGSIPGIHTLTIDSPFDTVTISHSARNRQGFALGAVLAAEWLVHNTGIYNIEDIIEEVVNEGDKER